VDLRPASVSAAPIPALAGIGLRDDHAGDFDRATPRIGWLEVHSENYFSPHGERARRLQRLRGHYPISLHGVGLSLGSTDPLNEAHLAALAALVERIEPALVSEHLCWCGVDGAHYNELLPLPYTHEALALMVERVDQVQNRLGRRLLIENLSSYLDYADGDYSEWDFLAELARQSGCGLLLDINNIHVSAVNQGWSAHDYLAAIPAAAVVEYHLGGHSRRQFDGVEFLIDTHDAPVAEPVWALYRQALAEFGPRPTLIEWDSQLPPLATLLSLAGRADACLEEARHACLA
jgi:uncharacterized protein